MTINEEKRDLFTLPADYILAHCISADFALGAGIAAAFAERGVKDTLFKNYLKDEWYGTGYCILSQTAQPGGNTLTVANLVTKERYFHKPTLRTVEDALVDFRQRCPDTAKIGMPLIGCGLDRLRWDDVNALVLKVFKDTAVDIIVCRRKN